jgi:ubiquinone biosynthesis accessory factor UbiK
MHYDFPIKRLISLISTVIDSASRTTFERTAQVRIKTVQYNRNGSQTMDKPNFFNDLQARINQAIENSPAKDIEKNMKSMLSHGFSKLDLVTREEFDIQADVLAKTRAKLEALEARVAELEAQLKK